MNQFQIQKNIDHYLEILNDPELSDSLKGTIRRLLIEEENRLGRDLEQLAFAELRLSICRGHLARVQAAQERLDIGSPEWSEAEKVIANFRAVLRLVEDFRRQMHEKVRRSSL